MANSRISTTRMKILAVETSCDDTGVAVLEFNSKIDQPKLLVNLVSSQTKIHAPWGGVVPTLARREHQKNLIPLLEKALLETNLFKIKIQKNNPPTPFSKGGDLPTEALAKAGGGLDLKSSQKGLNFILGREPELLKRLTPFLNEYQKPDIDFIAVTVGPGLEPALWTGINLARALSFFWNIPIVPVNHVEAHIAANFLPPPRREKIRGPKNDKRLAISDKLFPAVCLVVSGGHTQLILIKKLGRYQILGETRDDAAGEAFDKVAKMLKLGYPGGPAISELARKWNLQIANSKLQKKSKNANSHESDHKLPQMNNICEINGKLVNISDLKLPRPMLNSNDYDFSFSGLKTAVLYLLQKINPPSLPNGPLRQSFSEANRQAPFLKGGDLPTEALAKAGGGLDSKKDDLSAETIARIEKLAPAIAAEFQSAVVEVLTEKTIKAAKEYRAKTVMLSGGVAANDALREKLKLKTENLKLNFLAPGKNFCTDNAAMIGIAAVSNLKKTKPQKNRWKNLKAQANLRIV